LQSVATILDRFRRTAGVPAVVAEDIAAELAPVFAVLEQLEAEAQEILERAAGEAGQTLADAESRCQQICADWHERAQTEYERAEAKRVRASRAEIQALATEAEKQVRLLRQRGERQMEELVEEVVACVRGPSK
jgi:flagellar biosynthesis/type III secretory pathway protein FliH